MAPKDYRAIAKSAIVRPSTVQRPLRILVYSRNKKGKTRFCTTPGQGNVLILDPEHGTDAMQTLDPHVWPINSWEDLDDVYKFLRLKDHGYEWVAIDGLTRIANMALRWVMAQKEERSLDLKPKGVQIQDHGKAGELIKGLLYNFHQLPVGLIITAQERMLEMQIGDDADEDAEDSSVAFVPDLPKGIRSAVNSLVDVIGRLYVVRAEVKVKRKDGTITEVERLQRRLWLSPTVAYDTGYRSDHVLPDYMKNPTVPNLVQLVQNGKVTKS